MQQKTPGGAVSAESQQSAQLTELTPQPAINVYRNRHSKQGLLTFARTVADLAEALPQADGCQGCDDKKCSDKEARPMWSACVFGGDGRAVKHRALGSWWLALDYDDAEPPWDKLEKVQHLSYPTHTGGWHVVVRMSRFVARSEWGPHLYEPWGDVDPRAKALARRFFAPHRAATAYGEAEAPPWDPPETPVLEESPTSAPTSRVRQYPTELSEKRWRQAFEHGDGQRNRLAGAVGAVLAAWGWSDAQIEVWVRTQTDGYLAGQDKAVDDALRAATARREPESGIHVPGQPTLFELLGERGFVAEEPQPLDFDTLGLIEPAELGEPEQDPHEVNVLGAHFWMSAHAMATKELPPVPWVCEALACAPGAPTLLTGYGGAGKSTLAQHLALCVAHPDAPDFLGRYPVAHGPVGHIDWDQGGPQSWRTYRALGLDGSERLFLGSGVPWALAETEDVARRLLAFATGKRLVVIDSLLAATRGGKDGENDSGMRVPLDLLARISDHTQAAFLVVHHSNKAGVLGGDSRLSARGSGAIIDAVSCHLTYERRESKKKGHERVGLPVLTFAKTRHIYDEDRMLPQEGLRVGCYPIGGGQIRLGSHEFGLPPEPPDEAQRDEWFDEQARCLVESIARQPQPVQVGPFVEDAGSRMAVAVVYDIIKHAEGLGLLTREKVKGKQYFKPL